MAAVATFDELEEQSLAPEDSGDTERLLPQEIKRSVWSVYSDISVLLVCLITFTGDSSRGILFPVLWPLCQALGGSVIDLGYLVAMFSLGRLVITTPLGYFCDVYRHRLSLIIANVVLIGGTLLWANSYHTRKIASLYFAQFVLGVGSGSLGVTRSFVVEQVEPAFRTRIVSLLTALQYAGFTVSPFLGSLLSNPKIDGTSGYWTFALPAYAVGFLAFLSLLGLVFQFKDIRTPKARSSRAQEGEPSASPEDALEMKKIIIVMLFLNIATKGSIAVYETLGSQIGLVDYRLSSIQLGILISLAGAAGTVQLLLFDSFWAKRFTDIQLILGGSVVMMLAQLFLINYGTVTPLANFIIAVILMYTIGYPIAHTAVLGGFSKVQKSGPQAALMGWFATAGSLARIVLPIFSGYLDTVKDNSPFSIVLGMLTISYLGVIFLENRIRFWIEDLNEDERDAPLSNLQKGQLLFMGAFFLFAMASLSFSSEAGPGLGDPNSWEIGDI